MNESACVYVVEVYITTVYSIPPLLTSSCSKKRAMSPKKAGMHVSTESQCDRECSPFLKMGFASHFKVSLRTL